MTERKVRRFDKDGRTDLLPSGAAAGTTKIARSFLRRAGLAGSAYPTPATAQLFQAAAFYSAAASRAL
jgi:hypothetical protein